ncbi:MAG: thioredoxin domain-containing protein, partial [Nannocystaceae bacterium]|nr:thioredoxin domain-containing protein [Nannocystaceae bacterium]
RIQTSSLGTLSLALCLSSPVACDGKKGESHGATKATPASHGPSFDAPEDPTAALAAVGAERFVVAVSERDATRGAETPLLTVVTFSDFECPFCGKLAKTLDTLMPEYAKDVRLVFKHYPLPNHANAEPAAKASVAAQKQGKFWEFHDLLFQNQRALGPSELQGYGETLGLDAPAFSVDVAAKRTAVAVNEHFVQGRVLEVSTTPTLFINGRRIEGAKSAADLRTIFDEEIAAAKAMLAAGVKRDQLYATIMKQATPGAGKRPNRDPTHRRGEASKRTNYGISVAAHNPVRGPADALVTIVEYSALNCDACATIEPHLDALRSKYPADVRVVWRHFPEASPAALRAAQAGAAAHQQGKFWEVHDKMLANTSALQGEAVADTVAGWAAGLGLDKRKFVADISSDDVDRQIRIDMAVANKVRGTAPAPFLWVNGRIIDSRDTPSFAEIEALVLEEKTKAEAFMTEHGTSRTELYEAMRKTWRGAALIDKAAEL